jgi:multidrug efflux pump subunit AcrA (membrane-fusion protein)
MSKHVAISPGETADRLAIRELIEAHAHCADRRDGKGQMALFTADTHSVTVSPVVSRQVTETADFVGRVVAIDKVDVVARVPGFIEERNFTEGQQVKTGDLLFRIEQDTYKAAVDQQKANVAKAKATEVNAALQLQPARFCRPERGAPRIGQREVRSSPAPPDGCAG